MRFKIDWASHINGRKFTVFSLFYFVFEGNFRVQAPRGAYIWRGDLTEGFLRYEFGELIHGGAYFRNFTVVDKLINSFKMALESIIMSMRMLPDFIYSPSRSVILCVIICLLFCLYFIVIRIDQLL